jgi:hypothetical protein
MSGNVLTLGGTRKAVFTLSIDNYAPELTELTFPLMRHYARKIGADFVVIDKRKWPGWPPVYEKLQIHELCQPYDWAIFFDADVLVHPNCIDFTNYLPDDVCAHNGQDFGNIRFRFDEAMRADGRSIGTCGWFVVAPRKCYDLWRPTEQTLEEVVANCFPTAEEINCGLIDAGHLSDDYVVSRNIAKLKIKHTTLQELLPKIGADPDGFFWHLYTIGVQEKVRQAREVLWRWRIPHPALFRGWEFMFGPGAVGG